MMKVVALLFLLNISKIVECQKEAECGTEEDGVCVKGDCFFLFLPPKTCIFISLIFFIGPDKIPWQKFAWKEYVEKDLTEVDRKNPYERFAINLAQSINIGVDRKIPDNRLAKIIRG